MNDRQLLDRFADRRDETAFAALVERHGPMVWSVCRRALVNPADAVDAFQATFLVLVRRAASVRVDDSLGPWLYGVSVRVARRARVVAVRRNGRERTNAELPDQPGRDAGPRDDVRSVIDEELGRIPSRYRAALILCYLEGLTHEEAADRLSCPVGTVRSRLARGRDLLRSRLAHRGLAPAVIALTTTLAPDSAPAAELKTLFGSTARAAARLAAGRTLAGTVPARVGVLVAGVTRSMLLSKLALATSLLAASLLAATVLAGQRKASSPSVAPPIEKPAVVPVEKAAAPVPDRVPAVALLANADDKESDDEQVFAAYPAVVVKTVPPTATADVDPSLNEIRVTFNKEMNDGSWSWAQNSSKTFPEVTGKIHYEKGLRTCVLPVKLEPNHTYAIWLNTQRFTNFKDSEGRPSVPYLLVFRTKKP